MTGCMGMAQSYRRRGSDWVLGKKNIKNYCEGDQTGVLERWLVSHEYNVQKASE